MLPGTIYNFDLARTPVIDADSAQQPKTRKGLIRAALEKRLEAAAPDSPSLILWSGDFFGPGERASWFAQAMVAPGKPLRRIVNPARRRPQLAYLPDLAETFAQLLETPGRLRPFEVLQFEGLYDEDGAQMVGAIRRASGRTLPVRGLRWWLFRALGVFGGFPREAAEIEPYWRHPVRLDNSGSSRCSGKSPARRSTPLSEPRSPRADASIRRRSRA